MFAVTLNFVRGCAIAEMDRRAKPWDEHGDTSAGLAGGLSRQLASFKTTNGVRTARRN